MSMHARFAKKIEEYHETRTLVPVTDMHLHLVNFLQVTEGMDPLLKSMNLGNIHKAVVFGLPVKKKWDSIEPLQPSYYLDDDSRCYYWVGTDELVAYEYRRLSLQDQKRLAPCLCGFNPTDMACIDYIEYMFEKYPFWKGLGELLCRHDDLSSLTLDETARVNHAALTKVFEFGAKKNIPVCVHQTSTSVGLNSQYEYLHELRDVLDRHPETTLVWAHCGGSRRVYHQEYYRMVSGLLNEYPHLHVDLSWVVYEDIICKPRGGEQAPLIPRQEWVEEVVLPYQDRVMLGSDLCGKFDLVGRTMARYNGLLEALPEDARLKVARLNAEKLWFG
jgi:Amidohydrolase